MPPRLPVDVKVVPGPAAHWDIPNWKHVGPSTLQDLGASKVLAGQIAEQEYVRRLAKALLGESMDFYKRSGLLDAVMRAPEFKNIGNKDPRELLRVFVQMQQLQNKPIAQAMGAQQLRRLPPRVFNATERSQDIPYQLTSPFFRPDPNVGITERIVLHPKAGPLELIKTGKVPFIDVDTPTTGLHREVHVPSGITAPNKAAAVDLLSLIANKLGSTLRAYVSPGGVRAFDISKTRSPEEFYEALGKELTGKLDPHYVQASKRGSYEVPVGAAYRKWDSKTGKYYAFPYETVVNEPGFSVRTGPKFNRDPKKDYIAGSIGNIAPSMGGRIDPSMLETVLQMHDARIAANRSNPANAAMIQDMLELLGQGVKGPTAEFVKKNYNLLLALGLIPAAAVGATRGNDTA
jgi:hypothetical protein